MVLKTRPKDSMSFCRSLLTRGLVVIVKVIAVFTIPDHDNVVGLSVARN